MEGNYVLRKIRNGRVKIRGDWYAPSEIHMKYDGRLDGRWYCFGLYRDYHSEEDIYAPYVCLWGSREYKDGLEKFGETADCVEGAFVWAWWNKVTL